MKNAPKYADNFPKLGQNPRFAPTRKKRSFALPADLIYQTYFITYEEKLKILDWIKTLYPIWEYRYAKSAENITQRRLLRPVYWMGAWQFACHDYYRPPQGTFHRCVKAEPFPPVLVPLIKKMEQLALKKFHKKDIPPGWELNTCLINFYGRRFEMGKWQDSARVGEHKDFEPGPVASLSLGEKAMFQFVKSSFRGGPSQVVFQQWLEDRSLQIFGGERWKKQVFHRVQRVANHTKEVFQINTQDFETRRINFTFRYVPKSHIHEVSEFPVEKIKPVEGYLKELATHSAFFRKQLEKYC
jgi:alkylated DNA repair dioxygenase AlkB